MSERITLQRGLSEIKLLDARINKEIGNAVFVTNVTGKKSMTNSNVTKEEFSKRASASKQAIEALISRRKLIKQGIVLANATNKILVGKEELTIAEAIEKKNSINYEVAYLDRLKRSLVVAEQDTEKRNLQMEQKLDSLLSDKASSDKSKMDEIIAFQTSYRDLNETKNYDTLGVRDIITELENSIEYFKSEIDYLLSQANNTIYIEI